MTNSQNQAQAIANHNATNDRLMAAGSVTPYKGSPLTFQKMIETKKLMDEMDERPRTILFPVLGGTHKSIDDMSRKELKYTINRILSVLAPE